MTPIFYLHWVISALTTPTRSLVKTSLYGMTNNGFEMLEKARFFLLMYVSILCVISIDESPSLYFGISLVKNFFRSSGYFRGILFVLCETWRSAVLLVDGPKQSSVAKCRLLELSTSKMKTTCLLFRTISSVFFTALSTE